MFKKFALLLAPFVLSPLGSLLTPSAAHAQTWTGEERCVFSMWGLLDKDYTPWRASIAFRSDDAARAVQVEFGLNNNSERISALKVWESWVNDEGVESIVKDSSRMVTFSPPYMTNFTSPTMSLPWVSNFFYPLPRYVNVKMTNADGRTCTSKIRFLYK